MLKAAVQKGISFLPARERINYWFQKNVTKGVLLTDEHFGYKIEHASDHMRFFSENKHFNKQNCRVLELGTGWYPIVPIALYLSGYSDIVSVDLSGWLTKQGQLTAIEKFVEWRAAGKLDKYLPELDESRWAVLQDMILSPSSLSYDDINKKICLEARVENLFETTLKDQSFELICSNNTFEHVHAPVLKKILGKFSALIKPGGTMSHFIDMSDHFAHFDSSINIYNFLKYSKKQWARIDNDIQPQNRLRFIDYKRMYGELGIPITREETRAGDMKALAEVEVHGEYHSYSQQELVVSHGYIVSEVGS